VINLVDQFAELLAGTIRWVRTKEAIILKRGRCLDDREMKDAQAAGVKNPERIRLLIVAKIPLPKDERLVKANEQIQLITERSAGLTLHYGIYIKQGFEHDRRLIVHEFVHVAQFERLGGIEGFLKQYLMECLRYGYHYSLLERESDELSRRIVADST
jgi:hypothetical protein